MVVQAGRPGRTYNIGGNNECRNIDLVTAICSILDELAPKESGLYSELITYVTDRPGHDMRYAINSSRIQEELGWLPGEDEKTGLTKTVKWYLDNLDWCRAVLGGNLEIARRGQKGN